MDEIGAVGQLELDDMDFREHEPPSNSWLRDLETMQDINDRTSRNNTQSMANQRGAPQAGNSSFVQGLVPYSVQHNPMVSSVNTPSLTTHQPMATDSESQAPSWPYHSAGLNSPTGTSITTHPPAGNGWEFHPIPNPVPWYPEDQPTASELPTPQANAQGTIAPSDLHATVNGVIPSLPLPPGADVPEDLFDPDQMARTEELYKLYRESIRQQEESKPHRCPVIGCDKAYKNLNGLKYHRSHGHQSQRLQDNGDGTFSIINPDTSTPYEGSQGMEKEKPYNCDVCGKRYKNLNGLKYVSSPS
jgi:transcription factor SFP1